jgi:uncharacterized protein DUF5317
MRLIMFTVVAAGAAGLLAGGTFRDFPSVRIRGGWLAMAGVVLQFIPLGGAIGIALLYASFAALIAFAIINIRARGFVLILAGLAMNALVIVANQGMPVSIGALEGSHQSETLADLIANGGSKHHLADDDTVLLPLGDVIPLGTPLDQAISVGDVCVQLGAAWFIVSSMPRRNPRVISTKATT